MSDIIPCDALKKTVGSKKIIAVHHYKREYATPGQPATANSIVWSVFESMPSINQFIMVEIEYCEVALIMRDSPTFKEMEAGTEAIRYSSPLGVYVRGHVFNNKDFESVKQIESTKQIEG